MRGSGRTKSRGETNAATPRPPFERGLDGERWDVPATHPHYAPRALVIPARKDQNASVRCAALLVLERMGDRVPEEVLPALLRMPWADSHPNVRQYATQALLTEGYSQGRNAIRRTGIPPGERSCMRAALELP